MKIPRLVEAEKVRDAKVADLSAKRQKYLEFLNRAQRIQAEIEAEMEPFDAEVKAALHEQSLTLSAWMTHENDRFLARGYHRYCLRADRPGHCHATWDAAAWLRKMMYADEKLRWTLDIRCGLGGQHNMEDIVGPDATDAEVLAAADRLLIDAGLLLTDVKVEVVR